MINMQPPNAGDQGKAGKTTDFGRPTAPANSTVDRDFPKVETLQLTDLQQKLKTP